MSLKHLQLCKSFTTSTANDTETTSSHCSHCHSTPTLIEYSEITRRNCVHHLKKSVKKISLANTMFNKFLLIYAIVFLVLSPSILCMRHQDLPIGSALTSQMTPSTNSIDMKATLNDKSELSYEEDGDNDEEDSDEDQKDDFAPSSSDVIKEYEKQFKAFAKTFPMHSENKNHHLTTLKPRKTTGGSCSSTVCLARKGIEEASTESIRKHILMKLGMEHEPNITKYPNISEELRQRLCATFNINPENCLGKKLPNVEYQSDDPVDSQYVDYNEDDRDVVSEEEDVQFMSVENRIYAFPSSKFVVLLTCFKASTLKTLNQKLNL